MELKNLSKKIKDITFIPWSYIVSGSNTGNISEYYTTQTNEMQFSKINILISSFWCFLRVSNIMGSSILHIQLSTWGWNHEVWNM